ncbi:hypothetical protein Tco_1524677 [Tanacetum coccineum]
MDDPNITMEEYIRLEEEKARMNAIVFNDIFTSQAALSCKPTVSPLNENEIDFIILFDESEDEDYTPTVRYFDDLDYIKDFENEFMVIVYNDALTSKSDFLTEPTVCPQRVDEFNLKNEISLFNKAIVDINAERTLQFQLGGARRCISLWLIACSITGRSHAPEKVTVTGLFYLRGMDVGSVNIPYLLARYLRLFDSGRKSREMISRGQFVARLAEHFRLLTEERLQGLTVATAGTLEVAEGAPDVDEGDPSVLAPVQAPQPPPTTGPTRTMAQRFGRLEEDAWFARGIGQAQRDIRQYGS